MLWQERMSDSLFFILTCCGIAIKINEEKYVTSEVQA